MNATRNVAALAVAAMLSGLAGVAAADAVSDSFTRMLQHEPYGGPTRTTVARHETDAVAAVIRNELERQARGSAGNQDVLRERCAESLAASALAAL
jgi:hypothetical protein